MLVCTPSYEARSVADVVRLARARPRQIAFASSGNGSAQHLAGALFEEKAKVELVHVPYTAPWAVVLRGDEDDSALAALHAAGVRGVRFNLVSPVGSERAEALRLLRAFAPALARRGWHVQWYAAIGELPCLAQWQRECGLPFVLDHLAGLTPATSGEASWAALEQLARAGCWIKLSGWYRLQALPPYGAVHPQLRRVAQLFGDRMVWGSDWPHTSFAPQEAPAYESLWLPVVRALDEDAALRVRLAGERLYS